jgi:transposase InsO family protein
MTMDEMCSFFEISRQAHYQKAQRERDQSRQGELTLEMVRLVRRRHPKMGTRKLLFKLQPMLAAEDLKMGRDRLFELLRRENLLVERKKTFRHTTIPGLWRAPNRLLGLTVSQPNQVWVADITYVELEDHHFAYLFILMDLFSRYIVGWHVASSLASEGALASLQQALSQLTFDPAGLIHHSDHGVQYTSHAYMDTLLAIHIQPSMGAVGNCYDNIFAERLMGTLKNEYGLDRPFVKFAQVAPVVQEVITLYNTDRPHLSLNLAVPQEVYLGNSLQISPVAIQFPQEISISTH